MIHLCLIRTPQVTEALLQTVFPVPSVRLLSHFISEVRFQPAVALVVPADIVLDSQTVHCDERRSRVIRSDRRIGPGSHDTKSQHSYIRDITASLCIWDILYTKYTEMLRVCLHRCDSMLCLILMQSWFSVRAHSQISFSRSWICQMNNLISSFLKQQLSNIRTRSLLIQTWLKCKHGQMDAN